MHDVAPCPIGAALRSPDQVQQVYDTAVARSAAANGFYAAAGVAGATAIALFFLEPHFGPPTEAR